MLKTYLYIPEYLDGKINLYAKTQKKSKAEVIRQAIEKGLTVLNQTGSAQTLLMLAEIGERHKLKGIHDVSRMDELLWGKDWSKDE